MAVAANPPAISPIVSPSESSFTTNQDDNFARVKAKSVASSHLGEEDDLPSQLEMGSNQVISNPDDLFPCPRLARAVFGGIGLLVSFSNFKTHVRSISHHFRTYRDLKSHSQEDTENVVQDDFPSFTMSTFFYSPQVTVLFLQLRKT